MLQVLHERCRVLADRPNLSLVAQEQEHTGSVVSIRLIQSDWNTTPLEQVIGGGRHGTINTHNPIHELGIGRTGTGLLYLLFGSMSMSFSVTFWVIALWQGARYTSVSVALNVSAIRKQHTHLSPGKAHHRLTYSLARPRPISRIGDFKI